MTDRLCPDLRAVQQSLRAHDWPGFKAAAGACPAQDIADLLFGLSLRDHIIAFRALPRDQAAEVFSHLPPGAAERLIQELSTEEARIVMHGLSPDDRAALLQELPGQVARRLLESLPPEDLRKTRQLLGYREGSVGRRMTPDFVAVRADWTIAQALEHIRRSGQDTEMVMVILVTDAQGVLTDALHLRRFILAAPEERVASIMDGQYVALEAHESQAKAVEIIQKYDLYAVPVVDSWGVLLGIVTIDDVMDVAQREATEDFHKISSVAAVTTSLRAAGIALLYRKRIGWLIILVFMNIFSGAGIAHFADTIEAVVALVFFLPLLIDSGGNAGSQAATLMVGALATGDVRLGDWGRMVGREVAVALLLGLTMAAGVAAVASVRAPEAVAVVALAMVCIVLVGSIIGMSLPFVLLQRLRLDPATASAPLITSIADIAGVLIYFSIASWWLSDLVAASRALTHPRVRNPTVQPAYTYGRMMELGMRAAERAGTGADGGMTASGPLGDGIPADVRLFYDRHIDSVEQLEVLQALWLRRPAALTAADLARELGSTVDSIARRLAALVAMGLAETRDGACRFRPDPAHDPLVERALATYRERRVSVITTIVNGPSRTLRAFSDAFRLRDPRSP